MAAQTSYPTAVPSVNSEDYGQQNHNGEPNAGIAAGQKWMAFGQSTNASGTQTANQSVGVVAIPQNNVGLVTVTVNTNQVSANSIIFLTLRNTNADATGYLAVAVGAIVAGTSFAIDVDVLVNMTAAWDCNWWILN